MAAIEAIKGAGMTYQGSVSTATAKVENQAKQNDSANIEGSAKLAADTVTISTKQTSGDGSGSGSGAEEQSSGQQAYAKNAQIKKAVDEINKKMMDTSEAIFGIHEDTNRVTIKIVDRNTKEVVKEFPPEKTLDMIARVWEMAGLMVDERR